MTARTTLRAQPHLRTAAEMWDIFGAELRSAGNTRQNRRTCRVEFRQSNLTLQIFQSAEELACPHSDEYFEKVVMEGFAARSRKSGIAAQTGQVKVFAGRNTAGASSGKF